MQISAENKLAERRMDQKLPVNEEMVRHLYEAIERVRRDVAEVEFWADAIAGFAEPVPNYKPSDMSVWLPPEQATALKRPMRRS
jgi:hypothetical protein